MLGFPVKRVNRIAKIPHFVRLRKMQFRFCSRNFALIFFAKKCEHYAKKEIKAENSTSIFAQFHFLQQQHLQFSWLFLLNYISQNFAKKIKLTSFSRKNAKFREKFAKYEQKFSHFFAKVFVRWKP